MLFLGTLRATSIQVLSKSLAFRLSAIGLISALALSPLSPVSPLNAGQKAEAVSAGASPCEQSVSNSSTATVGRLQNGNGDTVACYVKFTSGTNSWIPPVGVSTIRLLVVGGGGSGAGDIGGGGGAGEFVESDTFSVSSSTIYPITVGAGGRDNINKSGWAGENSRFGDIYAYGGGGGLSQYGDDGVKSSTTEGFGGLYYGSSGGGGFLNTWPQTQSYPVRQSVALNNNSRGLPYGVYAYRGNGGHGSGGGGADATAGGGGGATGFGSNGSSLTQSAGGGGEGKASDITGVSLWYAGGGGGGVNGQWGMSAGTPGAGGSGVGGAGGAKATVSGGSGSIGQDAVANTGSGGGGASNASFGGQGAAGVVIVRYELNPPVNTSIPVISGAAIEGHTLHASTGNWSNASGRFLYQWQVSPDQTNWNNISGATKSSYTLTSNESTKFLRVAITASNGTGSTTVQSAATSAVDSTATEACSQTVSDTSTIEVTAIKSNSVITECVVKFTSGSNTWTKPAGISNVRLLLVGGGGAGGAGIGGGGGAGEMVEASSFALSGTNFNVSVGAMGNATQSAGYPGGNSTFSTLTAYGGGGGGYNENVGPTRPQGTNGYYFGSAGGGAFPNTSGTGSTQVYGIHTEYYRNVYPIVASRNPGGFGSGGGGSNATGGGGGGAGDYGVAGAISTQSGGAGGAGKASDITGSTLFYAGGGGGGINGDTAALSLGNPGAGGSGVGGSGGGKGPSCTNRDTGARELLGSTSGCWGNNGVPNTGSGGGGASNSTFGGDGGSGVVILRYSLASQSALTLSPTTTTFGATQALSTSGGSGSGAVTYTVTTTGTALCSVSGATLSFTAAGTCQVKASKASSGGYLPVSTLATTVTVSQASLGTVSTPTVEATSGVANSIDVSWSAVTNADTYYVKLFRADTNVEVAQKTVSNATSTTLTSSDFANISTIQNYKVSVGAASSTGNYSLGTQSTQVAVTTNIAQATLTVTSTLATYGSTRALTTSGGSGTGAVTYAVTAAGTANCSVSGSTLSYTAAGTCNVTATKAASTGYLAATSSATTITVNPASMGTVSTPTVTATSGVVNSIDVSWSTVSNADSYQIKLYTADTDVMVAYVLVNNVTSYTFTSSDYSSIANSRNYKITVAAYSSTGNYQEGAESTKVAVTTNTQYTVTYSYGGATGGNSTGSVNFITGATALTLPTPTKTGYTLNGWYTASSAGTKIGDGGASYSPTSTLTMHAQWTANSNTVTFNANDGSGSPATSTQSITTNQATALAANTFVRQGYMFSSWNTIALGGGSSYTNSQSVTLTGPLNLFAQWTANTYTVTYDYNNATSGNGTASSSFTVGGSAVTLPAPSRTGYTFDGWFDNSLLTGSALGSTYTPTSSTTLYASWTQITCTPNTTISQGYTVYSFTTSGTCEWTVPAGASNVQALVVAGGGGGGYGYDSVGGGGGAGGQAKTGNLTLGSSITITVGGGGTAGSGGAGGAGQNSSVSSITALGGGGGCGSRNRCANAGIPATSSSAATGGMGGTGAPLPSTGGGGSNTAGATTTTIAGGSGLSYNYLGSAVTYGAGGAGGITISGSIGGNPGVAGASNTGAGGSGGSPKGSTANVIGGAGGSGVIIFRVPITYTVSYDYNNATGGNSTSSENFTTGGTQITLPTPTRTGYTFGGWYEASDFSGSALSGTYSATSTLTLYAKWTAATYTVTYNYNGADGANSTVSNSFTTGNTQITLPVPTKTGYTFDGWFENSGFSGSALGSTYGPTSTGTVYAKWTANTYTVTYSYNNATGGNTTTAANYTVGSTQITLPIPTRTGYTFGGWYEASNLSGSALSGTYAPSSTRTIYAKWTANSYTVTYDYNSATGGTSTATDSFTVDSTQITLPTPTRTGYTFAGWFENSGFSGTAISGTYAPTSSLTIYAKWTANTYTVTYTYNGANGGNSSVSGSYTTAGSQLSLPVPTKTGYTFAGWFENSGFTGSAIGSSYTTTADVTIYARWTANNNTITFNANDGSGTPATTTQIIVSGTSTALTTNGFTRTGYTFANWNTAPNGSGTSYNDNVPVTITAGMTLYAQWQGNAYTVTYNYNNATSGNTNATGSYTVGGSALVLPTPSRTGYTFEGWYDNPSFTGSPLGLTYSPSGSRTIYASWTQIMCSPVTSISQGYTVYSFKAVGTCEWTVPAGISSVQALVVAGGGGGGYSWDNTGAGGGAGGQVKTGNLTLSSSITINVGAGGTGGITSSRTGGTGESSSVSTITALGGTGGCAGRANCANSGTPATANSAAIGGSGGIGGSSGRGGGGSNTAGSVTTTTVAGTGTVLNYTGTSYSYGAGGSGGTNRNFGTNIPGAVGAANTGRGGSGASAANSSGDVNGGAGGSGVIILRVANTYALSYEATDAASGIPSSTSGSYTTGSTAITLPTQNTMVRPGYSFAGWSTAAGDASTRVTNSGSYTVSAATTLYALWTAIGYSATYSSQNADAGSVPTDSTTYNIGNSLLVKANTGNLTRTGYTFAGWTLNSDGSGTVYQSGDSITISTSNVTLYPKWTANTYTVTYNTNGALSGTPSRTSDSYTTGNAGLSLPNVGTMLKTGYDFQGWSTSPTGTTHSGAYTTTSNVTLYAIWTLKPVTYTYNRGTANSTTLSGSHVPTSPTLLAQNSLYGTVINLDTTISRTITVNAGTYQFMGWSDGNSIYSPGDAYILGDTARTFTAEWVRIFEVRYVLNGGTGIVDTDDECHGAGNTCTDGQGIALSAAPSRAGYTFTGWEDQNGTAKQAGTSSVITSSSFLFYAQWEAINYSFTFNSAGGSITPATQVKNIGQTVTLPSPGTKAGHTFAGWLDGSRTWGEGAVVDVGTSGAGFIALWTPDVYTVSYDWNGGAGAPTSDASYTYGTSAITLPTGAGHSRDGYVFDGWSTTPGGQTVGAQYTPSASTMLYARWADGDYAVTLNSHGGSLTQSSFNVARNSSMTLPTPTRAGFVFEGWYEGVTTGSLIGAAQSSFTPAASRTLHARWVQNSLAGINPAHINSLASITVTGSHTWSGTHSGSGTGASLTIPQGSLPTGTELKVSFIEDLTRHRDLIDDSYAYYTSVAVHWLTGTGDSATVPAVSGNTPVSLTLTNPAILPGAKVFMILGGVATEVAQATQAGQVTIQMTQDPEFVIAATPPTAPASVSATAVSSGDATVSWTSPTSTGGSPVTSYTVTATPGGATCVTSSLSCTISGLSDGVSYSYAVTADNAVGTSPVRSTTVSYVPPAPPVTPPVNVIPVNSGNTPSTVPVSQVAMSAERSGVTVVPDAEQAQVEDDVEAASSDNNSTGVTDKDSGTDAEQPAISFWLLILVLLIALLILIVVMRRAIVARR